MALSRASCQLDTAARPGHHLRKPRAVQRSVHANSAANTSHGAIRHARHNPKQQPAHRQRLSKLSSSSGSAGAADDSNDFANRPTGMRSEPPKAVPEQRAQSSALMKRLSAQLKDLAVLGALLGAWYASNIFFNIYNKQVLKVFAFPTTCTLIHLMVASVLMGLAWVLRFKQAPVFDRRTVDAVFPLSVLHLAGFLTTNMSLGAVNVSLTHTIKSLEPFFTVFLSYIFLGSVPTLPVMLTLVPIVAGVVVASATDLSFNWYGFATAMGSNLFFQSRNVISKKYMVESSLESLEDGNASRNILDEINLFACISIAAAVLMIPVTMAFDGANLFNAFSATTGSLPERASSVMSLDALQKTVIAGVCRTVDVLASYALLSRLNPVTHSVGNCVKRVVVIGVSIVFFGIQASALNIIGTALALSGVFAYSMAKRMSKDRPDLRASLRATIRLQNFLSSLVPEFIKNILENRKSKQREAEAKARAIKAKPDQGDEPEFFL